MYEKVQEVNKILANQGASAVQKFSKLKSTGRDIYGYQPQKVFDAVNQVFGADGWTHEIVNIHKEEKQVIATVAVTLGKRTSHQFGEHRIMAGDVGSAYKSAVTDGIQKALSLFGVGSAAYRGELEMVYNAKESDTVESDESGPLFEAARKILTKEAGRIFWKENIQTINKLSKDERTGLVRILEN